jgi:hypothetical protein
MDILLFQLLLESINLVILIAIVLMLNKKKHDKMLSWIFIAFLFYAIIQFVNIITYIGNMNIGRIIIDLRIFVYITLLYSFGMVK